MLVLTPFPFYASTTGSTQLVAGFLGQIHLLVSSSVYLCGGINTLRSDKTVFGKVNVYIRPVLQSLSVQIFLTAGGLWQCFFHK